MLIAAALVVLVQLPWALALLVFCAELAAGLMFRAEPLPAAGNVKLVVLMPAHNEAKGIAAAIRSTLETLRPGDRLVVVADNCTDDTASVARAAGAEVVERSDPGRRGKGYALDHGLAALAASPPDCVVVLDADCRPVGAALPTIAALAVARKRPVQACYLLEADAGAGPVTRFSNFAFVVKNRFRQRGMARIGRTCVLTGSGMAFPWADLATVDLANGEIVEDLVLGLRFAATGKPPLYADGAVILSQSAPNDAETQGQRQRWEHGFIAAAARFVPGLVRAGVRQRRREPLWLALHLGVPPFVLLLSSSLLVWVGLAILCRATGLNLVGTAPLGLLLVLAVSLVAAVWWVAGRADLPLRVVLRLPLYVAAKAKIWRSFLGARQATWNRTGR